MLEAGVRAVTQRDWVGEWTEIVERKSLAMERSRRFQTEVVACLRRKQPPPMAMLRAADAAAAELAQAKATEERFLCEWQDARKQA
jgi:hypothetical protein